MRLDWIKSHFKTDCFSVPSFSSGEMAVRKEMKKQSKQFVQLSAIWRTPVQIDVIKCKDNSVEEESNKIIKQTSIKPKINDLVYLDCCKRSTIRNRNFSVRNSCWSSGRRWTLNSMEFIIYDFLLVSFNYCYRLVELFVSRKSRVKSSH